MATLLQRIDTVEAERRLPDNVIPFDQRRERRALPRWMEWTQANEKRAVKDLTGYIGGDAA